MNNSQGTKKEKVSESGDMVGKFIRHDGDVWRVLAVGATRGNGSTYCHLSSMVRFRRQVNGLVPVQMGDWLTPEMLEQNPVRRWPKPVILER